jgi:uncharacterized protein YecE (DUF72 family)
MKKPVIHIGTSGWHYKHWKGTFYPADTRDAEQFEYYSGIFDTVEINNSFYRLPPPGTFTTWKKTSPPKFLFAVKASRFITHMKKLKLDGRSMRKFFVRTARLEKKLGPILFQLPPTWKINTERLETFLSHLPKGQRYAFEFRNHSWYDEAVYDLLKKHNCAFCIYELEHHISPLQVTADFVYVRLHGPGNKYQGNYKDPDLKKWARQCVEWNKQKRSVFVYFDNDQAGYAAFNAQQLMQFVKKSTFDF